MAALAYKQGDRRDRGYAKPEAAPSERTGGRETGDEQRSAAAGDG
ncbi:MAG: hypothetical protein ACRDYB_10615 [Acidimicrobiales bacterium]